jgi:hypothetical protein
LQFEDESFAGKAGTHFGLGTLSMANGCPFLTLISLHFLLVVIPLLAFWLFLLISHSPVVH